MEVERIRQGLKPAVNALDLQRFVPAGLIEE